jgi:hypothetical protein
MKAMYRMKEPASMAGKKRIWRFSIREKLQGKNCGNLGLLWRGRASTSI